MPDTPCPPITVTRHAEARIAQRYPDADPRHIREQVVAGWEQREYILDEGLERILVPLPLGIAVLRDSLRGGGAQTVLTVVTPEMRHDSMSAGFWKRRKGARPPTPPTPGRKVQQIRARTNDGRAHSFRSARPERIAEKASELERLGTMWLVIETVE